MRFQQLFSQTLRQAPADVNQPGLQMLMRAGYVQALGAGNFGLLPLGTQVMNKIAAIIQAEMNAAGAGEVSLPPFQPMDLWEHSGLPFLRFAGVNGREMAQASTSLPGMMEMVRSQIRSYRQIPLTVFNLGEFWVHNPGGGRGLAYSSSAEFLEIFQLDSEPGDGVQVQASISINKLKESVTHLLGCFSLPALVVEGTTFEGVPGIGIEIIYPSSFGETNVLDCEACGYTASQAAGDFLCSENREELRELKKVATPECKTIESLASFLGIPQAKTAKAVFLVAELGNTTELLHDELIFCVVRGDREINEDRLRSLINARSLRPATEAEILATGAVPGYASPIGLKNARIVVDLEIPRLSNLAAGANESGYHLLNVNYGRDFTATEILPIAAARPGDGCPRCGKPLSAWTGIRLGRVFQVKPEILAEGGCTYRTETGIEAVVQVTTARLNLTRVFACQAEEWSDEHGLKLPAQAAPFAVHMVVLGQKDPLVSQAAQDLENLLCKAGIEPLVDDRSESAGVKFMDADLIGCPMRITVSDRALKQGGVEVKMRSGGEAHITALDDVLEEIKKLAG
jgi:prolyl-tRNA synthetase